MLFTYLIRRTTLGFAVLAGLTLVGDDVDGQIVRVGRGGGVFVSAPFVRVQVGPIGVPGRPYLPYVRPRRAFLSPQEFVGNYVDVGPTAVPGGYRNFFFSDDVRVNASAAADSNASQPTYPTTAQLAEMDASELLNTLVDLTRRLDERLGRFNTGAGWRRYLKLPDDALPQATSRGEVPLGMKSLRSTLNRFDSVAEDPQYRVISELPLFGTTRAALSEVIARYGGGLAESELRAYGAGDAAERPAAEELPPPEPSPPWQRQGGFDEVRPRSILNR